MQASYSDPGLNFTGKVILSSYTGTSTFKVCGAACDFDAVSSLSSSWAACFSFSCPIVGHVDVGSDYVVSFRVTVAASTTGSFNFLIDSVDVTGANALVSGANLFLVNYATQQLFNINGYNTGTNSDSSILINYDQAFDCAAWGFTQASPKVCLQTDLNTPDFNISLSHATLITVTVGGSIPYTRTIIPQPNLLFNSSTPTQTVYLNTPSACPFICSYSLTVNDFTGFYPSGSEAFIQQGNYTMTSAPLDAQSVIAMTMPPGLYNFTLISPYGQHSITEGLSLTATNNAPSILIQNGSSPILIGPFQQFTGSATWDCDTGGITSTITDSLGTMTQEVFNLYRYNQTADGGVLIATHTSSTTGGPGFSVSHDFLNSTIGTDNLNVTTGNEYKVGWTLTTPHGIEDFGQYPISISSSCSSFPNLVGAAQGFRVPTAVLGLSQIFATANAYEEVFSIVIIIATAGIVAARFAHMVMLVVGAEVGILGLMTWLPVGPAAVLSPIFLLVGALGFLSNRARKPIT